MEKVPMTVGGFAKLEAELKERQQVERPRIIAAISEARSHGDLSENAEYHSAKEQQSLNEGRIAELESLIARAEVIDVTKLSGDTVKFGATVKLVNEDTEEERVWQIVGDSEADAKAGRISISSPLARALIGKAAGTSSRSTRRRARRATRSWKSAGAEARADQPRYRKGVAPAGRRLFRVNAPLKRCPRHVADGLKRRPAIIGPAGEDVPSMTKPCPTHRPDRRRVLLLAPARP
jgi:transcription elongation factor GreA